MGEEQTAGRGDKKRKDETGSAGSDEAGLHPPFEDRKCDNQQSKNAMNKNFRIGEGNPEAVGAQGPSLRIASDNKKDGERQENQRPVSSPRGMASLREESKESNGEDNDAGPVMVVFGPGLFRGSVGARARLARDKRGGGEDSGIDGLLLVGVDVFGKIAETGAGQAWETR